MNAETFKQIIIEAQKGNPRAFDRFFKETYQYSIRRLTILTKSEADAKDVFMDIMYKIWSRFVKGEEKPPDNIKEYVYRAAHNLWLDKKRKNKRSIESTLDDKSVELYLSKFVDIYEDTEFNPLVKEETEAYLNKQNQKLVNTVLKAFKSLGKKCRKLLKDTIIHKLSLQVVQKRMGFVSYNSTKAAKHNCKKKLMQKFEEISAKIR